jgi:hypothetical protein
MKYRLPKYRSTTETELPKYTFLLSAAKTVDAFMDSQFLPKDVVARPAAYRSQVAFDL